MADKSTSRRLTKRQSDLIVLLAAILAFGVFVVKEVFRDESKEFTDAISASETLYLTRTDMQSSNAVLGKLDQQLSDLRNIILNGGHLPSANAEDVFFHNSFGQHAEEGRIDASLENIGRLSQKTEKAKSNAQDILALEDRLERLKRRDVDLTRMATPVTVPKSPVDQKHFYDDLWQRVAQGEGELSTALALLSQDTDHLVTRIWNEAESEREKKEHTYNVMKYMSWCVYVVASILGIIAKLLGVEAPSPAG
jgi:hypothetical protein